MNAPSASRLRPAVAGVRRVKRLWLSFVDPPLSRLRRTDFVEYLFFILGCGLAMRAFLKTGKLSA